MELRVLTVAAGEPQWWLLCAVAETNSLGWCTLLRVHIHPSRWPSIHVHSFNSHERYRIPHSYLKTMNTLTLTLRFVKDVKDMRVRNSSRNRHL